MACYQKFRIKTNFALSFDLFPRLFASAAGWPWVDKKPWVRSWLFIYSTSKDDSAKTATCSVILR